MGGLGLFIEMFLGFYCGVDPKTISVDASGKLMSLQSLGNINKKLLDQLKNNVTMKNFNKIKDVFDEFDGVIPKLDIGRTIHYFVEKDLLPNFFKQYCQPEDKILYSGGVAQNIVWNTELKALFPNLMVPPHSYDGGLSLGGIEYLRRKHGISNLNLNSFPYISLSETPDVDPTFETIKETAKLLADNKIVGWYQGSCEIGPRALGNRSILMNPMIENGKDLINRIKKREEYRPFGAAVLEEHTNEHFDIKWKSPFMLYTAYVKDKRMKSITHVDGTCRIQTVGDEPKHFRLLLEEFFKLTGCPVLLNTSLNLAGEPIAAYKDQALQLLNQTDIDYMIIGDDILKKKLSYE